MLGRWLQDIESLEEISRDDTTRALFLRLALLSQSGRLKPFLRELHNAYTSSGTAVLPT